VKKKNIQPYLRQTKLMLEIEMLQKLTTDDDSHRIVWVGRDL